MAAGVGGFEETYRGEPCVFDKHRRRMLKNIHHRDIFRPVGSQWLGRDNWGRSSCLRFGGAVKRQVV